MLVRSIVFAVFLAGLSPSVAARIEFATTVSGERLKGSTVCFWAAGDENRYFAKFMGDGTDPVCLPADDVLDLPLGNWNYFAFHKDGYVSYHPDHISVYRLTDEYQDTEVEMVRAGTLDLTTLMSTLSSSQEAVVYLPNNQFPHSPSAIRRLLPDQTEMLVPAGSDVVPFIMNGVIPVAVGEPIRVAAGERKKVPAFAAQATAVIPIRLALTDDLWLSGRIGEFSITAESDGKQLMPLVPIRTGTSVERSLLIVRPPRPGTVNVRFGGSLWKPAALEVITSPQRVSLSAEPLVGIPAAHVELVWQLEPGVAAVRAVHPACDVPVRPAHVRVLECDRAAPAVCRTVRELADPANEGSFDVASLDPGQYQAEFAFPPFEPKRVPFTARAAEHSTIGETIGGDTVSGKVTRGGSPISAAMVTVNGIDVVTGEIDGRYAIPVKEELGIIPIAVEACDGTFVFTVAPTAPVPAGSTFDIDIPDNRLELVVVDADSGKAIAGAHVTYGAIHPKDPDGDVFSSDATTDETGKASVGPLPTNHRPRVCAEFRGYHQGCTDSIKLATSGITRRRIEMKAYSQTGRIVASGRILAGNVFWVDRNGVVREEIYRVQQNDGTFFYDHVPVAGDYLVVVSQSHPLVVFRPQRFDNVTVTIPSTAQSIPLLISPDYHRATATPTIAIGGYLVPHTAFAQHGRWRKLDDVTRGQSYEIRDVVVDGPVSVLLGPSVRDRPLDVPSDADLFVLPQYRGLIDRREPGPDGRVVF